MLYELRKKMTIKNFLEKYIKFSSVRILRISKQHSKKSNLDVKVSSDIIFYNFVGIPWY